MTGERCVEVNWGREKLLCHGGEGALSKGREKGERAGLRVQCWVYTRKKTSPDPEPGSRGSEGHRFLETVCGAQILRFWKCMTFVRLELWHAFLGRRGALATKST